MTSHSTIPAIPAIRVEGLGKRYRLGLTHAGSIRDLLDGWTSRLGRLFGRHKTQSARPAREDFWALSDIDFAVAPGEVLGIIGDNGAGKSTLLKILSRITPPTTGKAILHGRVSSLLEIGTGFHPELTGRENIFLNGTILGMSRREIRRKFDAIVAFAGIETFLDTPVKRYSSGMHVRLAFAVAAHLEPDILIVDEVLAVGDAAFQKKCLGKMHEVSGAGRTVLFVSHNMGVIKSLCGRSLLLESGRLVADGPTAEIVDRYLHGRAERRSDGRIPETADREGTGEAQLTSVQLSSQPGGDVSELYYGQPFAVSMTVETVTPIEDAYFEVSVSSRDGVHIACAQTFDPPATGVRLEPGRHQVTAELELALLPGHYRLDLGIHHGSGKTIDFVPAVLDFSVSKVAVDSDDYYRWEPVRGFVRPQTRWQLPGHSRSPLTPTQDSLR
jgi:lipopolysaccharide transport system ATP-binding protein